MGAKAGRKGGRGFNILTRNLWRHYRDKMRRKGAKKFAIEEQQECGDATCGWVRSGEYWCHCDDPTTCDNRGKGR